jgi:hypothetical protein
MSESERRNARRDWPLTVPPTKEGTKETTAVGVVSGMGIRLQVLDIPVKWTQLADMSMSLETSLPHASQPGRRARANSSSRGPGLTRSMYA